jgi:predicted transcriptional regulator
VYVVVQQIEGNLVMPVVQRKAVELPPALTLFAVIAAGLVFGFVGLNFAASLTVVAYVLVKRLYVREALDTPTRIYGALAGLGAPAAPEQQSKSPVVSIRASIKPDYLVCMECGRKQKTLKRHLATAHGMTPEQYRRDYGLPDSYPMVASNYSEQRRAMAQSIGLGRKPAVEAAPAPTGRKAKSDTTNTSVGTTNGKAEAPKRKTRTKSKTDASGNAAAPQQGPVADNA